MQDFLREVATFFYDLHNKFVNLAQTAASYTVLRPLEPFFWGAADLTNWIGDRFIQLDNWLDNVRRDIDDMLAGWKIDEVLKRFYWFWVYFVQDVTGFIHARIKDWFGDWDWFRIDPPAFVNEMIKRWFHLWEDFRRDPTGFIHSRIREWFGRWDELRIDPTAFVHARIKDWFGLWDDFRFDPTAFVHRRILDWFPLWDELRHGPAAFVHNRIREWFGEWDNFRANPGAYILDKVEWAAGLPKGALSFMYDKAFDVVASSIEKYRDESARRIKNVGEHVLRYMMEGKW